MGRLSRRVDRFDLDAIAASGQTFTWSKLGPEAWRIVSGDHVVTAEQNGERLALSPVASRFRPGEAAFWEHYLALDEDYAQVLGELALPRAVERVGSGIRILNQDWWDTAVSFVVSQNNNIVRIGRTVSALMGGAGGLMPRPAALARLVATDEACRELGLGYRGPYLRALAARARRWRPSCLSAEVGTVPLDDQVAELMETSGVGVKVATCICLFGLGYHEAVPRDTWIIRAEREHHIAWHPTLGGIQQQYVFAWMRAGCPGTGDEDAAEAGTRPR